MIIIAVEGKSDKGVIEALLYRLEKKAKILVMRGNRPTKIVRIIKAKIVGCINEGIRIEKIIVLKDIHKYKESTVRRHLETIEQHIRGIAKFYGIIIRYAIESWILADVGCLRKTLGIFTRQIDPESVEEPDKYLDNLLMKKNRRYIKSRRQLYEIAKNIDIEVAIKNSKSLQEFIQALKDP